MSDSHLCVYLSDEQKCWVTKCQYHAGGDKCRVDGIIPNRVTVREPNPWNRPAEVDIGGAK